MINKKKFCNKQKRLPSVTSRGPCVLRSSFMVSKNSLPPDFSSALPGGGAKKQDTFLFKY